MLKVETVAKNFKIFWSLQVHTCVYAYRTLRACPYTEGELPLRPLRKPEIAQQTQKKELLVYLPLLPPSILPCYARPWLVSPRVGYHHRAYLQADVMNTVNKMPYYVGSLQGLTFLHFLKCNLLTQRQIFLFLENYFYADSAQNLTIMSKTVWKL